MNKKFVFFIFFIILTLEIIFNYPIEKFSNIKKINFNELQPLATTKTNPICCLNNFCILLEKENFVLKDEKYRQSSFNKNTYENEFSYTGPLRDYLNQNPQIKKICILGFGLGGLPLEYSKRKEIQLIDCVDINPDVYKLYRSVITENPSDKINYYLGDAESYLLECDKKYDLIIDDIFTDTKIFYDYKNAKKCLNKNGTLFINMHNLSDFNKYEKYLKELFSKVYYIQKNELCVFCIN